MTTAEKTCPIPDCGKPQRTRGYCESHYRRLLKSGDPLGGGTTPGEPMRYFNEVVLKHHGDECLAWPYGKGSDGYGMIWHGGRSNKVHRLVCEEVNGPPPTPEHQAAHSCGKGREGCCAPGHLVWKTPVENWADKLIHGTHNRGDRNAQAKLAIEQVKEIRALRGVETQKSLAARFGIAPTTVWDIQVGRKWSWL